MRYLLRVFRWLFLMVAALLLVMNGVAFLHARALTRFGTSGTKTAKPEHIHGWQKARLLISGATLPRPENTKSPADFGLPFETRFIPSTDGVVLEAWLMRNQEERGWVLLFHGYSESKQQTLLAARRFHELGFSTAAVDFRGTGGSTGLGRTSLGYFEAEDVLAAVHWAETALGEGAPVLYGFSMGSAAVLRAVGRLAAKPRAIVVESVFDRMLSTVENRFRILDVPSFPMARLLVFWGGLQNGFSGFEHNPVDYAIEVMVPTLVVHGERDERVTVAQATEVYKHLAGPSQMVVVPGVGHEVTQEMKDQDWREMISRFLDQRPSPTSP